MNAQIRILGIAIFASWVILIAFLASAVYCTKDLNFRFGEPQFTVIPNHKLLFSLPLYIDNRGYYSLKEFNITTSFSDEEGTEISKASTFVPAIPKGQNVMILHNTSLNMDSLLQEGDQYLFKDSTLTAAVTAGLNFAELIPAQLSTNITYQWGAPLYNFMLGEPSYSRFSSTQSRATVAFSFENHATFDLAGNIRIELYSSANSFLGESQTDFNAPSSSSCHGSLEFSVPSKTASLSADRSGHFKVFFSTSLFEFGPLVVPYG